MPYIGRDAQTAQSQNKIIDDISSSFNGSTTSFALLVGGVAPAPYPATSQNLLISVGGVIQEPDGTGTNGYQLTGANIVFSAAPASGQSFFGVILAGADYVNAGANFPDGDAGTPSITFSQDLDTGLFRSGTGTTSITSNNNRIADFGTTEIVFNEDGDDINFRVEGDTEANLLFVDAGNDCVGIGTSQPAAYDSTSNNLVVGEAGSGDRGITIASGTSSRGTVMFADGTSGLGEYAGYLQYHHNGNFLAIATNNAEAMRIDSGGNVGIGTSSPDAKLKIQSGNSDTPASSFAIRQNNAADTAQTTFSVEASPNDGVSRLISSATSTPQFAFYTGGSESVRIDQSGDVGIGTSNPGNKLDVVGGVSATNFLGRAGTTAMTIGIPGTDTAFILYGSGFTSDPNRILFRTGSVNRGEIDHVGRLVMGGISPGTSVSSSFCTSGRLQTTASYTNTTASGANMHIGSSGLVVRSTSSARYKTDIETLENSYADKLLECRPVWYRSIATDDTAHPEWGYYGFIAEEVADVDPRLVHFDEQEDGTLQPEGVQYTQMIAHLVNIVKRQKQAIETLETKVAALEEPS